MYSHDAFESNGFLHFSSHDWGKGDRTLYEKTGRIEGRKQGLAFFLFYLLVKASI